MRTLFVRMQACSEVVIGRHDDFTGSLLDEADYVLF